jgi:hypothetical protein
VRELFSRLFWLELEVLVAELTTSTPVAFRFRRLESGQGLLYRGF